MLTECPDREPRYVKALQRYHESTDLWNCEQALRDSRDFEQFVFCSLFLVQHKNAVIHLHLNMLAGGSKQKCTRRKLRKQVSTSLDPNVDFKVMRLI